MIRALIRTLSDSALFLKDSVQLSSPLVQRKRNVTEHPNNWSLKSFLSRMSSFTEKKECFMKVLPMEIISHIIKCVAVSPEGNKSLKQLLLLNKK
jgi:hypothetical protein